jgi:hypothetical protein
MVGCKAKQQKERPENITWAGRELESMPMIIRTAMKIEKMMEFMVEAGLTPTDIWYLTPSAEDRRIYNRRVKMWGVIQKNFRYVAF